MKEGEGKNGEVGWSSGEVYRWEREDEDGNNQATPYKAYHISTIFRNNLLVYGGNNIRKDYHHQNNQFFIYNIDSKLWIKYEGKVQGKELNTFQPLHGVIYLKKLVVLGQNTRKGKAAWECWNLSIQKLQWSLQEQKGEIPEAFEGSSLVTFESWVVLFGGARNKEMMNLFYLFNVSTKTWEICKGNYQFCLKGRYHSSMICYKDKIYLFGGYYQGINGVEVLNDFYEISIVLPLKNRKAEAQVRMIKSFFDLPNRAQHRMVHCNDNILLLGGTNGQSFEDSVWSFNIETESWRQICRFDNDFLDKQGQSLLQIDKSIWIVGGLSSSEPQNIKSNIFKLQFNESLFSENQNHKQKQASRDSQTCILCSQRRQKIILDTKKQFNNDLLSRQAELIHFPFNAFGMLADNCLIIGAQKVIISVESSYNDKDLSYIKIEDNGKFAWSYAEFISTMFSFGHMNSIILAGIDKKIKKSLMRTNSIRQYGINLKLGCLRLGNIFLFIANANNYIFIFTCERKEGNMFEMEYYILQRENKKLVEERMIASRISIESKYGKYIKPVINDKSHRNVIFIFDTIIDQPHENITVDAQNNDLLFGNFQRILSLGRLGFNLQQSIDVSLRAYLSLLYLKNEGCQINFYCGRMISTIVHQSIIQKVDKMSRAGSIIEMQESVEFQVKLIQLYYIKELKKSVNFFSNGVLLYCKNRLINRFRPKLGQMLHFLPKGHESFINHLPFFGYIQLPESLPINPLKTDFSFDIMVDKMMTRLKFVQEFFRNRVKTSIISNVYADAALRREIIVTNVLPIKQLPRRNRGHYGQRNWDELPDRFELNAHRKFTKKNQEERPPQNKKRTGPKRDKKKEDPDFDESEYRVSDE